MTKHHFQFIVNTYNAFMAILFTIVANGYYQEGDTGSAAARVALVAVHVAFLVSQNGVRP